jgi:peptide deformylase
MKKNKQKKVFMNIIKHPDPVLRAKNINVASFKENENFNKTLVVNMIHTMNKVRGVGIAAPQVGINVRLFVALINRKPLVVFNPEIINGSPGGINIDEMCLSLPGEKVNIKRPNWIEVKYQDLKGKEHVGRFEGINSIIICHEIDHVQPEGGKLIIDHKGILEQIEGNSKTTGGK